VLFHADVTISDLDETSARENIYIENANTGEKAACEFEKVGDILRLGASFLTTGEWKFVIDKNILKKDGTPLRKFDYTIEFTVVEIQEISCGFLSEEFNNLMDEIDTVGYLAAETFLLKLTHIFFASIPTVQAYYQQRRADSQSCRQTLYKLV
jgi:hypothetical protein